MRLRVYLPENTFDWESTVAVFRVGRAESCAMRVDGASAKFASWEHAEFKQGDDGAYVTDLGSSNGTYVDGVRVADATRLRVGAVIQIGRAGPRLEVLELSGAARPIVTPPPPPRVSKGGSGRIAVAAPSATASGRVVPVPTPAPAVVEFAEGRSACPHCSVAFVVPETQRARPVACPSCGSTFVCWPRSAAVPVPLCVPVEPRPTKSTASSLSPTAAHGSRFNSGPRVLVACLMVAMVAAAAFFVARDVVPPHKEKNVAQEQPAGTNDTPKPDDFGKQDAKGIPSGEQPKNIEPQPSEQKPTVTPPSPADPWAQAKQAGLTAYRLIALEDPQTETTWPLAGAVIVGPWALLTTGDVGVEVARYLERGFGIRAMRDSDDIGVAVDRVRIHFGYQQAEPDRQLYFNLAIIFTCEQLPNAASPASSAELGAIERGQPLGCAAIDHAGDSIDRFQQLQPQLYLGKVFLVTSLAPDDPAAPRLLHLRGTFSEKSWGSPIFNDHGRLVALYCEAAPADDRTPADRSLHYAKPIDPGLIEVGLSHAESTYWVAPVIPPTEPPKEAPSR